MKKDIFIVNGADGAEVVSSRVLANDIKSVFDKYEVEYRRCDVEALADEAVKEYVGKAITAEEYSDLLDSFFKVLVAYKDLTPYTFMNKYFKG